jgi:hypothetical protein
MNCTKCQRELNPAGTTIGPESLCVNCVTPPMTKQQKLIHDARWIEIIRHTDLESEKVRRNYREVEEEINK